jgi:hypothetical protein
MKKLVVAAAAVVASLAVIGSAAAASLPSNQWLRYEGGGSHVWTKVGGDSPHDANARALRLHVGDPNAGEYVAAYSQRSLHLAKDGEAMTNLSFEFKQSTHVGAGAPRISVELQNGDVAYLSAYYCNHPFADGWGRADFTRFVTNCSFFVSGETGGQYAADGTRSAWKVYTDAHPDQIVERAYFVADETGRYRIDRLSLGAGVMYTKGNRVGTFCPTEASC